ncbi:MAG TPA: prepilin peptidase [Solirubrobacteraceae bacterium]|nr:prepilin peptidase [Solirubrobacteraceae bacterium]
MSDGPAIAALAVLGLLVGSFLNVVVHRLPRGESLLRPRSRCVGCGTQIAAYDNVPVVSWLVLRGRCRHCGEPIAARYPLIEALTGAAFAAVAAVAGLDAELSLELPFAALMIAVAAIDLEHRIVPNRLLAPAALWAVAAWAVVDPSFLAEALAAGAGAFAFLLLAALAYPAGMGMGDVKLAGAMGLYLGLSVVPALLTAFVAGSVVGIAMIVREGRDARKAGVPFAPFLALGGLVGLLAGDELISLYADRFL